MILINYTYVLFSITAMIKLNISDMLMKLSNDNEKEDDYDPFMFHFI